MLRVSGRWKLAAPAIFVLVITSSWICYRAVSAHDQAALESATANRITATLSAVDPQTSSLVEPIGSAAEFRDAATFRGRLYLAAPDRLDAYDSNGALVETYRVGRELPAGELTAIGSGRSGGELRLFTATQGAGVLEFNGTSFRQLLPSDAHLRNFTAVLGLNAGRTLFGTQDHGVLAWNGKTLVDFLPVLQRAHITALTGSDADIWIGTLAEGAYRFHAGQLDHISTDLPDPHVLSIALAGTLAYVGTPVGVVEFRDGRKVRNLAEGYFARSLEADGDSLAVGTEDEGIVTVPLVSTNLSANRGRRAFGDSSAADAVRNPVRNMAGPVDKILRLDGVRYALAKGLYRSEAPKSTWTPILRQATSALTDRNISALAVAHDGRVWVGYFDRGLDVADPRFENVRHFEDDRLFCVNRILEAQGGSRTSVATANGLVLFDATLSVQQVLTRKDGLLADHITDVVFRPRGMVIATPAGLSIVDAEGIRSLYVFHGLVNNHVYSLAAFDNRIAAGTLGGLSLLADDVVETNYTTANSGLKHNWISAVAHVGNEWFAGTYGAGVMRLDAAGQWHGFTDFRGGVEVNPNAMAQAGDKLYAGTLGKGLWIYSQSSARWTNLVAGLPSLNVTAVAAGNGYVYVGTDNGLVRLREVDFR